MPRWPAIVDHGAGSTVIFGANAVCLYLALRAPALLPDPAAAECALDVEEFHLAPLTDAAATAPGDKGKGEALGVFLDRLEVAPTTALACLDGASRGAALGAYVLYPALVRALALPVGKTKARKTLASIVEAVAKGPHYAAAAATGGAAGGKKGGKAEPVLLDVTVSPYVPAAGPAPLPSVDFAALGLLSSLKVSRGTLSHTCMHTGAPPHRVSSPAHHSPPHGPRRLAVCGQLLFAAALHHAFPQVKKGGAAALHRLEILSPPGVGSHPGTPTTPSRRSRRAAPQSCRCAPLFSP